MAEEYLKDIQFLPYGENGLLINFPQQIDQELNQKVHILSKYLEQMKLDGILGCLPAYCSLLIHYDAEKLDRSSLIDKMGKAIQEIEFNESTIPNPIIYLPVSYEEAYALDLEEVSKDLLLSSKEIINKHCSCTFNVYMLGFLPGYAYMGKLPEDMYVNRKATPRTRVPAGAVGLAGLQTGIYPVEAPGGWQIIGCTPIPIFDARNEQPFLLGPGDKVQFYNIEKKQFEALHQFYSIQKVDIQHFYERESHPAFS